MSPGPVPSNWGFEEEEASVSPGPAGALAEWVGGEPRGFELSPREFWMSFLSSLTGRASNYASSPWAPRSEHSTPRPGYSAPWSYEDCVQYRPDPTSFPFGEEDMEGLNYDELGPPVLLWVAWPGPPREGPEPGGCFYHYVWASSEEEALERLFPDGGERVVPEGIRPLEGPHPTPWKLKLLAAAPEGAGVRLERVFHTVSSRDDRWDEDEE